MSKRKGYPYEVPPMLGGPVMVLSATMAAALREDRYRSALDRIRRESADPKSRAIAFSALAGSVEDPGEEE